MYFPKKDTWAGNFLTRAHNMRVSESKYLQFLRDFKWNANTLWH